MPDILIRGMEMPTKGNPLTVLVYPDGTATWKDREYEAIELPPHGDLIDVRKISLQEYEQAAHDLAGARAITQFVRRAPVVVPAERREG